MTSYAHDEEDESLEAKEAEHRRSPAGKVLYKAILLEADEELDRASSALFWSGLAAGLAMGLSLIAESLLRHYLPDARWSILVSKLGYTFGFLVVILGRQQLFTENTLTPMLPLMKRKDGRTLMHVLRLWGIVLAANLIGAAVIGLVLARTNALSTEVREEMIALGQMAMSHSFGTTLLRAIFAGWLIALLVWMLPYAESAHFFVIVAITWLIGVGEFSHVIAGAVETFAVAWAGDASWGKVIGQFLIPALIGNILGGVTLVAALNHAQVVSGEDK